MADEGRFQNSVLGIITIGVLTSLIAAYIWQRISSTPSPPPVKPTTTAATRNACVFDPVSNVRALPTSSSTLVCSIDSVRDIQVGLNAIDTGKGIWWTTTACQKPGYIADDQVHVDMLCSK